MPTGYIKVLHVIARLNIGGTARYLDRLLPELEAKNINVLLAVGRIQSGEVEDSSLSNLRFRRIENLGRRISPLADFKAYLDLRQVVKEYKPDLIHSHTFKAGLLSRIMFFRIPKVHTFHGHLLTDPEFSSTQKKIIINIEKILARFAQKLIVTGKQVSVDLIKHNVGREDQFISIPGESYFTDSIPREIARKALNLDNRFTILWLARVVPVKNPKLLVEVAGLMPDCTFLMAGDGIELDSIKLIAPPNLNILGFIDAKDILLAGDVFLSTSLNEGIPYSILEAKSAGLPIVAVKAGALHELISDGVDGFLVEPNSDEIVVKLRKLQKDPDLLESMCMKAKEAILNNSPKIDFSIKHVELYREILKRT
jgi:glycosyltransferase involved in cell wall biosynthesis